MSEKIKYLFIQFSDGSVWKVPAHIIAKERAEYYAENDSDNTEYQKEFDYTMGDDHELTDWANGNMDWDEIEEFATHFETAEINKITEWTNAKKWIQED